MMYEVFQMDARKIGREEGIEIGEARGEVKGTIKTPVQLVKDGLLDIKEACKRTNMAEQEFRALLKQFPCHGQET